MEVYFQDMLQVIKVGFTVLSYLFSIRFTRTNLELNLHGKNLSEQDCDRYGIIFWA